MIKKITFILFLLIIQASAVSSKTYNKKYIDRYYEGLLDKMRAGNQTTFDRITYSTLGKLNDYIHLKSIKNKSSFIDILFDKEPLNYQYYVSISSATGLFNRDPRVRLYFAHLLLKLSPKRKWIIKYVQKALDPQGDNKETVDRSYYYTDIYRRYNIDNVKDSLVRLLELGASVILLKPHNNLRTYQDNHFEFEWSTIYGGEKYQLFVDDIIYHEGPETRVIIKKRFLSGTHRWQVVAKDFNGDYITASEGIFYIRSLGIPKLRVMEGYIKDLPRFRWNHIKGAEYYELHQFNLKKNTENRRMIYRGKKNYFNTRHKLKVGNYIYILVAKSFFQKKDSQRLFIKVFMDKGRKEVKVHTNVDVKPVDDPKKIKKGENVYGKYQIKTDTPDDIQRENLKETEEEKELDFDIEDFTEKESDDEKD